MILADKAEGNGEIQNARGCLNSLSKLMGWDDGRKDNSSTFRRFAVESLIDQIEKI